MNVLYTYANVEQFGGRSLVAVEDIKKDTIVLTEKPLITISTDYSSKHLKLASIIVSKLIDKYTAKYQSLLKMLHICCIGYVEENLNALNFDNFFYIEFNRNIITTQIIDEFITIFGKKCGLTIEKDHLYKFCSIMICNSHQINHNTIGYYEISSKLAHDCSPNCIIMSNLNSNTLIAKALVDIKKSQALTFSYLNPVILIFGSTETRQNYLNITKLFYCNCERCKIDTSIKLKDEDLYLDLLTDTLNFNYQLIDLQKLEKIFNDSETSIGLLYSSILLFIAQCTLAIPLKYGWGPVFSDRLIPKAASAAELLYNNVKATKPFVNNVINSYFNITITEPLITEIERNFEAVRNHTTYEYHKLVELLKKLVN